MIMRKRSHLLSPAGRSAVCVTTQNFIGLAVYYGVARKEAP